MAAGAAITVTTKSGTNTFRGSAFEFFNNEKLNANPFYFGRGAVPAKLPVERQTFGGTLGGPIVKNRLFFFGSYEGYRSKTNRFAFYTVPDAALRNGDFSNALNTNGTVQRIYDPFTGDMATGTGRAAVREQRHPGRPVQCDLEDTAGLVSDAERRGDGRGQPDQQLSRPAESLDDPPQRGRQDQLEPHAGAPVLGQVQRDARGGRRPVHVPDRRVGRRRRAHEHVSVHRRPDLVAEPDAAPRQLVRHPVQRSVRELAGLSPRQHRPGSGDSRNERSGAQRPAVCGDAAVLDRLHRPREHADLEPDLHGSAGRLVHDEPHEGVRQARHQGRLRGDVHEAGLLAA